MLFTSCANFYPSNTFRHATETQNTFVGEGSRLSSCETLLHAEDKQTRMHVQRDTCNVTHAYTLNVYECADIHNYSLQHFPSITLQLDIFRGIRPIWRTAVEQWLRCCATNRKVAGSIPDGVIGIFH